MTTLEIELRELLTSFFPDVGVRELMVKAMTDSVLSQVEQQAMLTGLNYEELLQATITVIAMQTQNKHSIH